MRISQLVSNFYPTSHNFSKAINSHVASLANGLIDKGHKVDLFAADQSETKANLVSIAPPLSTMHLPENLARHYIMAHISNCYYFSEMNADIVHSHFSLLSSFFSKISSIPTVISIHSPITEDIKPLMNMYRQEKYVSFSLAQRKQMPELNWYANIYHGVDTNHFAFNEEGGKYLLYLGRLTEDKGVHLAIQTAKTVGLPLIIAGTSYPTEGYWQKEIEPHIDGINVKFIGEATFEGKVELLQKAKATLFPTQVAEVFGYVMIESMSCGTPVIGFNNGSVPEIVKDGQTGFVVNDVDEMIEAVKKIDQIDRKKVRQRAELYFSVEKMVSGYEKVYKRILADLEFQKNKKNGS